jgi:hypothetical protein
VLRVIQHLLTNEKLRAGYVIPKRSYKTARR